MYDTSPNALRGSTQVDKPPSRIRNLTESVKMQTDRVRAATQRVVAHAHSLGFFDPPKVFDPPKTDAGVGPTPIITSLEDAIREHDRAIDELAAALNLFD